jgi:hypothetical protein
MKLQTLVRMQMLMGLGAALLLAGSVRAQQTMDPDGSSAVATEQPERAATVPMIDSDGSEGVMSMALGSRQARQEKTEMAPVMIADVIMMGILMVGTGAIALYALAATRRNRMLDPVLGDRLRQASYGPASGATTH